MKSTKPHWIAIGILLAALTAIGVKVVVLGSTAEGNDGRTEVLLDDGERLMVLAEMRGLLEATQQIVDGLAKDDLRQIEQAALPVGSQAMGTMDFALKAKLPIGFKQLGFSTHYAFDDIAAMARDGAPHAAIQEKLADTMSKCIACHSAFQIPSIMTKGESL